MKYWKVRTNYYIFLDLVYETEMIEKSQEEKSQEEKRAVAKYLKLRAKKDGILCPALGVKVKFFDENFKHLTYKDQTHKRSEQEVKMRSICFLYVEKIIKLSHTYQEFLTEREETTIKKHGKKEKVFRDTAYIWLVAIMDWPHGKHRIRVVLKWREWFSYAEYLSIMPAWNTKGHPNFMWEMI